MLFDEGTDGGDMMVGPDAVAAFAGQTGAIADQRFSAYTKSNASARGSDANRFIRHRLRSRAKYRRMAAGKSDWSRSDRDG